MPWSPLLTRLVCSGALAGLFSRQTGCNQCQKGMVTPDLLGTVGIDSDAECSGNDRNDLLLLCRPARMPPCISPPDHFSAPRPPDRAPWRTPDPKHNPPRHFRQREGRPRRPPQHAVLRGFPFVSVGRSLALNLRIFGAQEGLARPGAQELARGLEWQAWLGLISCWTRMSGTGCSSPSPSASFS